jgi:hypothetical protein
MTEQPVPPSNKVEIGIDLGDPEYLRVAEWIYGQHTVEWWQELGDLLGGRPGWRCDLTSEGLLWSFGPSGSSLFSITLPEADADLEDVSDLDTDDPGEDGIAPAGYELYDDDADEMVSFANVSELLTWLEANEHRHANHLAKLREMAMTFDWKVLKTLGWKARVTYVDGTWVGTVDRIPAEATFSSTLPGLTSSLRELIATAFDAPAEVTPDIELSVVLDQAATAALTD